MVGATSAEVVVVAIGKDYGGSWPGHLPGNCVIWMLIPAIHVLVFVQTAHTIPKCFVQPRICLGLPLCLFFPSFLVHFACEMATSLNLLTIFDSTPEGNYLSEQRQVYFQIREFSISSFRPYGVDGFSVDCFRRIFKHQSMSMKKCSRGLLPSHHQLCFINIACKSITLDQTEIFK